MACALVCGTAAHPSAPAPSDTEPPPAVVLLAAGGPQTVAVDALEYLVADDPTWGPTEIEARGDQLPWQVRQAGQQHRLEGRVLWLRLAVQAESARDRWFLRITNSDIDYAALYTREVSGQWMMQESGDSLPQSRWALPGRMPTFELPVAPNRVVHHLLRIEHHRVDFSAPLTLYQQAALGAVREQEQFMLGGWCALVGVVALAALAQAALLRDRNFAAFSAYAAALLLGQVAYLGLGQQYLWSEAPEWNQTARIALPSLAAALGLRFVQALTEPARFSHTLHLLAWAVMAGLLAALALDLAMRTRTTLGLVTAFTVVAMLMAVWMLAVAWRKAQDAHVGLIALGFLPVLLTALVPLARATSLLPASAWTRFVLPIGIAVQLPILYAALNLRAQGRREARLRAAALPGSDVLTGLADRRQLERRLAAAQQRAQSDSHQCGLLVARLANVEALAAEHGPECAQRALVMAAALLRGAAADIDLAARVAEHDFALLLGGPSTSTTVLNRAQQIVAKGLQQTRALPPTAVLRFHVAVALLPEGQLDAAATLGWMEHALDTWRPEARRAIRPLNF